MKQIKLNITESIEDTYKGDPIKACKLAIKQTSNLPEHDRLEAINTLLHGYGTEAIRGDWQNGYWCDIVAEYVNVGDTYNITVMQVRQDYGSSKFIVMSIGDFIEKYSKKYGIY